MTPIAILSADGTPARVLARAEGGRVYAFDPNQPRHPAGDERGGEWSPRADVPVPALTLVNSLRRGGGFSYSVINRKSPTTGLMLSLHPERSAVFERGALNAAVVKSYAGRNRDLLTKPGNFLGGWYDRDSGRVFLDISTRVTDHERARALSTEHRQRAYWSIDEGKEYRVTSEARAHSASNINFVAIEAGDLTDEDAEAFVEALLGGSQAKEHAEWNEEDHPRHPAGTEQGGEFAPKNEDNPLDDPEKISKGIIQAIEERPGRATHGHTKNNAFFIVEDKVYAFNEWKNIPAELRASAIRVHSHSADFRGDSGLEPFQPLNAADVHGWLNGVRSGSQGRVDVVIMSDGRAQSLAFTKNTNPKIFSMSMATLQKSLEASYEERESAWENQGVRGHEVHTAKVRQFAKENGLFFRENFSWKNTKNFAQLDAARLALTLDGLEDAARVALLSTIRDVKAELARKMDQPGLERGFLSSLSLDPETRADILRVMTEMLRRARERGQRDAREEVADLRTFDVDDKGHEGVWRTINGRKIFIRTDESLEDALTRSLLARGQEKEKPESADDLASRLIAGNASKLKKSKGFLSRFFAEWNEEDHPRHPAGTEQGGEFAPGTIARGIGADVQVTKEQFEKIENGTLTIQDLEKILNMKRAGNYWWQHGDTTIESVREDWASAEDTIDSAWGRSEKQELLGGAKKAAIKLPTVLIAIRPNGLKVDEFGSSIDPKKVKGLELSSIHYKAGNGEWKIVPARGVMIGLNGRRPVIKKYTEPFTPREALKWLSEKAFWISGLLAEDLTNEAQAILVEGMKTGKPMSEMILELGAAFIPYLGDPDLIDEEQARPHRLETIIRTNTVEAYNQGRLSEFVSDELAPFLDGVRYSAILDERTTEVCNFLHEKVFKPDDPMLDTFLPPNHFNCRSVVVPVVVGSPIDPSEFITAEQIAEANSLMDTKFLEQRDGR